VPVKVIFRCEFCDATPNAATQRSLEGQLQELLFGQYLNALPERWLVWHGRGIYGPIRYACGRHRGELKAFLREHYGTLGKHPWAMGPHPTRLISRDTARARALGGFSAMPKWGLPG
jgi:hypothetical protein